MTDGPKWERAERGGGRICEVCKQTIGRRTPAMRRDEQTNDFRGDDIVTFRHLHCHQTRALSDKVWAERGGPRLLAERDEAIARATAAESRVRELEEALAAWTQYDRADPMVRGECLREARDRTAALRPASEGGGE